MKRLLLVADGAASLFIGLTAPAAHAYPCAGKGGAVYAQSSGLGDEASVEVLCANGEELF